MSTSTSFTAAAGFDPAHPPALALYCSDGRFTRPVEELLRHVGHARLDTLTLPGGPGLLSLTSAGFVELDATKRGASFLITGHQIQDVYLIAHAGCGYYRARFAAKAPDVVERTQREDLRAAAGALEALHPGVRMHLYYARVTGGRVTFDPIGRAAELGL